MEKTSDRDELFSLKSSANDVAFENTRISIDPPAVQLKADDKSEPESEDKAPAETPFQLAAEGSEPTADNGNISNGGNPNQNNTGLPDQLKSGVESLSGYSLDDVKVHYNSDKPAQLQAHAYAQGSDIHLGPGQEKHLPHEAWHVVQQKQGRVQATKQMKAFTINDDAGLEKEADVMGAKASQLKSTEEPFVLKKTSASSETHQLVKESVSITGGTHLVSMSDDKDSLYHGENERFLRSGDLVEIDKEDSFKSRRGPNQEVDSLRDHDKGTKPMYMYYKASKVNGKPLAEDDLYLRDETFLESTATNNFNEKHDTLTEKLNDYNQLKSSVIEILNKIDGVIELLIPDGTSDTDDLISEVGEGKPAVMNLIASIRKKDPKTAEAIDAEKAELLQLLEVVSKKFEETAYSAKVIDETAFSVGMINLSEECYQLLQRKRAVMASASGSEYSTAKDTAAEIFGVEDAYQTTLGLTAAVVGAPGLLTSGSTAASVVTGVSYFLGAVGIIFGTIGTVLGIKAVIRGYNSEKKLKKVVPQLDSERLRRIALYAQEKKRKKKWGGAITITAGVAAVAAGILGIVALTVTTLGVGAVILGIGAALIGLSILAGKIIHHFNKRKKWRKNMAGGIKDLAREDKEGIAPPDLYQLAKAAIAEDEDPQNDSKDANKALEDACVARAESRRDLLSKETVHYYFDGTPKEKYEALLIIEALNISKDKIEKVERTKGRTGANSLVAKKMQSW